MSNQLFAAGKERLLGHTVEGVDLINDDLICILVDHAVQVPDPSADVHLSDIDPDAIVATSDPMTGKSTAGGVFNADNVTFGSVVGPSCESLLIFKDTGVAGTSPLIAFIDTMVGLPVTPNGGDVIIQWDPGPNKIFAI